jgi:hypothetical protein
VKCELGLRRAESALATSAAFLTWPSPQLHVIAPVHGIAGNNSAVRQDSSRGYRVSIEMRVANSESIRPIIARFRAC